MSTLNSDTLKTLIPEEEISKIKEAWKIAEIPLWIYWEEFINHYLRQGRSEHTLSNVRDTVRFIILNAGIYTIDQCNNFKQLREKLFEQKEQRNWSNSTLNSHIKNLNTYFIWLENEEYITENKIKKLQKFKEKPNEQLVVSKLQVQILLGHLKQRRQTRLERWRNELFMSILLLTGARPCELISIQCKHITKSGEGYKLAIKGRKQKGRVRYYKLPSWVRDSYEVYISLRQALGREEPNLFVSSSKRTGWTYKGVHALFKRLSNELGFPVTAYSIRRFVATRLSEEGVETKDIMRHLGHTRPSTTEKYIARSCVLTNKGTDVMASVFAGA